MPLVTPKELYLLVKDKKMAVGAFNVHNMEYTQAVIQAAEIENMPVILMLGEPILEFANLEMLATITLFAAKNAKVPVAVTLDHGKKMSNISRCIELGISVMVDGSDLPYNENVEFTRRVVELAHEKGLSVEGELGSLSGIEDDEAIYNERLTDPELAMDFVEKTGIDALAVSIGNQHGKYQKPPQIEFDRLIEIVQRVSVPLVMHGGSDLPEEVSIRAINEGIKKFNIGTDLKYAMSYSLKETLSREPMPFQPHQVLAEARDAIKKVAQEKISLFKNGNEI
jgi:ketose-bisphosphate aldolase